MSIKTLSTNRLPVYLFFQPQSADYYQYDSGSEVDWGIRGT